MSRPELGRQFGLDRNEAAPTDLPSPAEIAVFLSRGAANDFETDPPARLAPWDHAIALNARICMLRAAAARAAEPGEPPPAIPEPLRIGTQGLRDLDRWCSATEGALAASRRLVRRSALRTALDRLRGRTPPLDARVVDAAEALVHGSPAGAGHGLLHRQVRRRLESLAAEIGVERTEDALELAAHAVAAHSPVAARAYADRLISLVLRSNTEHRDQRTASLIAARYLEALAAVPDLFPPAEQVTAQLAQVRSGNLRLGAELHDTAERLRCRVEEIAERAFLADLLTRLLGSRGFSVWSDWKMRPPAVVVVASRGPHSGYFLIDDGVVQGGLNDMPPPTPGFLAEIRRIEVPVAGEHWFGPHTRAAGD